MSNRVVVGMSGGVDSSVAAGLLLKQGYDVIGCTMLVWSPPGIEMEFQDGCCGLSAAEDARKVASCLGIPHYVLDLRDLFYREVVENYVDEYRQGRTPNPCIRCNERVKFGAMLKKAEDVGAGLIATGHYVRSRRDEATGRWELLRARDRRKDQSYALYRLSQEQISRSLFPLGEMEKAETRQMAAEWGLPTAGKPDSQETCFVPGNDYPTLLRILDPAISAAGPIVTAEGQIVGQHQGAAFYAIGQRKGLGAIGARRYVSGIDPDNNRIIVSERAGQALNPHTVWAQDARWLAAVHTAERMGVTAQIRYNMPEQPGFLQVEADSHLSRFHVEFETPVWAATPGQALVCYKGDRLIGGGIIASPPVQET